MALILNIDTATEYAGVCLSNNSNVIGKLESEDQKNHGAFVQPAIEQLLKISGCKLDEVDAVAVTKGPGSYTGLRVGLSSAKGLCYALNKPLILVNTLEVMAITVISQRVPDAGDLLFCPMIDARRMEVFTAIYDSNLREVLPPAALILNEASFEELLKKHKVVFSGSGISKAKDVINHPNAIFSFVQHSCEHLALLANEAFNEKRFADVAYAMPFYLKEFFSPTH